MKNKRWLTETIFIAIIIGSSLGYFLGCLALWSYGTY